MITSRVVEASLLFLNDAKQSHCLTIDESEAPWLNDVTIEKVY